MMKESQLQNEVTEEFVQMLPGSRRQQVLKVALMGMVLLLIAVFLTIVWPKYVFAPRDSATLSAAAQHVVSVSVDEQGFSPHNVQVSPGTKVVWSNQGSASIQVAADPFPSKSSLPSLDSGQLTNNQTYSYTFSKPGTYRYHDQLNPVMGGTITVQ